MRNLITLLFFILVVCASITCGQTELENNAENKQSGQKSFPDIVDQIKRGVAYLEVETNIKGQSKIGTAFLIHKLGILATCRHTLFDTSSYEGKPMVPDTSQIYVKFHEHETSYKAQLLIQRKDRDIAIIQVKANRARLDSLDLLPITFGRSNEIREGLDIACTGYDLTQKTKKFDKTYYWLTTHRGIVSCVFAIGPEESQEFVDFFQADILINWGVSGSPVYLADNGKVVGMCEGFMVQKKEELVLSSGLANCIPAWAICKLFTNWVDSVKAVVDTSGVDTTTN